MIRHGIQTDIVELDPAVYNYATEYFGLSKNHTAYLEDAVGFIKREVAKGEKKYEYILHDVFTGGAVPASLFTLEVFEGLKALLAEDGVVAIVSSISLLFFPPIFAGLFRFSHLHFLLCTTSGEEYKPVTF
jgi:spermidine synthase